MPAFDPIDSWFEKGFRVRQQKAARTATGARRDSNRDSMRCSPASRGAIQFSSNAKPNNIKAVIKKSPEVMVKITGSSKGLKTLKNHLEYISRNGDLELKNELGESIHGLDEIKGLRQQFKNAQIPQEGNKREFLHVMFSMPKGTAPEDVKEAVSRFCSEEFSNRKYVMALHTDTEKPHVHVCVSTRDFDRIDEPRLSPRKADLFRWRMGFADKLRELGVDAAASDRSTRFNFRKSEKAPIRQIRADNPNTNVFNESRHKDKNYTRMMKALDQPKNAFTGALRPPRTPTRYEELKTEIKAAIQSGKRPINPLEDAIKNSQQTKLAGWKEVSRLLENEGQTDLSKSVNVLIKEGNKDVVSRNQSLFDAAIKQSQTNSKEGLSK